MKFLVLNAIKDGAMPNPCRSYTSCKSKTCRNYGCTCHGGCSRNYDGPKAALY